MASESERALKPVGRTAPPLPADARLLRPLSLSLWCRARKHTRTHKRTHRLPHHGRPRRQHRVQDGAGCVFFWWEALERDAEHARFFFRAGAGVLCSPNTAHAAAPCLPPPGARGPAMSPSHSHTRKRDLPPPQKTKRAALVSRQFVDSMSRLRVEGLLAAFPKLVSAGKQHTFVETENVRYLYQPLEVRGVEERGGERRETRVARPARMRKKKRFRSTALAPRSRSRAPAPPGLPTTPPTFPRTCTSCWSPTRAPTSWKTWRPCACWAR